MNPENKFQLVVRSRIVRGESPSKPVKALPASNPHEMNRVTGYLDDGQQVVIAQRTGKGGMDFNKLLGGKVYAVAADGMSPIYVKKEGARAEEQKLENGLPAWSSSGFYQLSSQEYPALELFESYALLLEKGEKVALLQPQALENVVSLPVSDALDLELAEAALLQALGDDNNMVSCFDEAANRKRERAIRRATEDAQEAGERYSGVQYKPLCVSPKDGNSFVFFVWSGQNGSQGSGMVLRELKHSENGKELTRLLSADEALEAFRGSEAYARLVAASAQTKVTLRFVRGHVMRTSVSFKKKVQNFLAAGRPAAYGDSVFISGAMNGWVRAIVTVMYSQHPGFPLSDYESNHYVVACRQAEVGMNKGASGWSAPVALSYNLVKHLMPYNAKKECCAA